ncbi:exopolysaccharide Pel transporter PelG [Lachnospiraceae bacterium 42-17]|jgi:uncharacterized membrane protein|nr:exopolysaccharide Pel transporter PelG [Dorea sp.]
MAGIGTKLTKIFEKSTITTYLIGFGYSSMSTVTPMFVIILNILLMGHFLEFSSLGIVERELFSCTVLYIFIFSLLSCAPFNSVLSKYMSDVIYEERYQDIRPCYYLGLLMNLSLSSFIGIPFCLWEHFVGKVDVFYVFTGYCGYIALVLVFYSMIYLSIAKAYQKISLFYTIGMVWAFFFSLFLRFILHWGIRESMLFALMTGFYLIAFLEIAVVKRYFVHNSNRYKSVLRYFKKYWQLVVANFCYILGLYIHNFVFWTTDMRMVLVKTFVCNQPYDMATCLAMFTNISATIIFITRVEMYFHDKYKNYSESVIGGRGADIDIAKSEMFRQLSSELLSLVRIQFIITAVVYLLCVVLLPRFGFSSLTLRIYPCLAAGYFIVFLMYSEIIFLYYFNDLTGATLTSLIFCLVTLIGSIFASRLPELWYGLGVVIGAFSGWTTAYFRLRYMEKHLDAHIFCEGSLLKPGMGTQPPGKIYDRYAQKESGEM